MNSSTLRSFATPGTSAGRAGSMASRFACGAHLRASFPVVSNRTFVRAWAARRARAGAAALVAKRLSG